MKTVTLSIASREDLARRARAAFAGLPQSDRISFASPELLWETLTPRRWAVLRALAGQGVMSMRAVARRLDRDIKGVHGDLRALVEAGVIEESDGGVLFAYDEIHVDFTLTAAA